jgi:sugar O-acyltransferase (sialic acid O-acetyltransferase NeuD family)
VSTDHVIVVGAFHEILELCRRSGKTVVGIFDNERTGTFQGIPILGTDKDACDLLVRWADVPLIISPDMPTRRKRLYDYYQELDCTFCPLTDPSAVISSSAELSEGVLVAAHAHISSNARVGKLTRVNVMANLMHDTVVEDFVTIAPNAVLLGNVIVETMAYVGSNATVLPGRRIGARAMIGAGSVVTRDVDPGTAVAGNPARSVEEA